ncbi:MAG TPA: HAD-IIA family hydrolase [Spirochaetota bacterium]|nr:HAD-IIA family hydrolase [Spirochaetota bacterium]
MIAHLDKWFKKNKQKFAAVSFDIDGVLLLNHKRIKNSEKFIKYLRRINFPFTLLTNDSNHSKQEKCGFFRQCGHTFNTDEIISCGDGLIEFVRTRRLKEKLFFIMGRLGSPCYALKAGLRITRRIKDLPRCQGVIIGETQYDWETTINAVTNYFIQNPRAFFIVPNPDEYFPVQNNNIRIAAGGCARFIKQVAKSYGVKLKLHYLGKPYRDIFRYNHHILEQKTGRRLDPAKVLMLGDNIAADVKGAAAFGYRSGLLLTGLTTSAMLKKSKIKPTFVFKSF